MMPFIPARPSVDEVHEYAANIMRAYCDATPEQRERGKHWYPVARDLAGIVGGGNVKRGAGILAALSPNKSWEQNVRLAMKSIANGRFDGGHFPRQLEAARRIMGGEDPERVLPMGIKTGAFYRNILDPSDAAYVTIDRHAHDVAVGKVCGNSDRGLTNRFRYQALANAYKLAARWLNLPPSEVQAATWVAHRDQLDRPYIHDNHGSKVAA